MNFDELKVFSAQGRMRHEPGVGFTLDGALVTDAADHAICNRLLGLSEPFVVPASLRAPNTDAPVEPRAVEVAPEPERDPNSGVARPDPEPEPPVADDAPVIPTPEPEED